MKWRHLSVVSHEAKGGVAFIFTALRFRFVPYYEPCALGLPTESASFLDGSMLSADNHRQDADNCQNGFNPAAQLHNSPEHHGSSPDTFATQVDCQRPHSPL